MAPNLKPTHQSPLWYGSLPWELAICNVILLWPLEKPFQTNHVSPNTQESASGSWLGPNSTATNNPASFLHSLPCSFAFFLHMTKERDLLVIASMIEKPRGPWAAAGGNETEAPEAAGDCQSSFARPGCAVAGIKELAGQPAPQSWAERFRAEVGDSQGSALQLQPNREPRGAGAALLEALFTHGKRRLLPSTGIQKRW